MKLSVYNPTARSICWAAALAAALAAGGCGGSTGKQSNRNFFSSGSREADQRASQRMALSEQLTGSGEGAGEKAVKKAESKETDSESTAPGGTGAPANKGAKATEKLSLFVRLGGEAGISKIVADVMPRLLQDPRVNWDRKGVKRGGFSIHRGQSQEWKETPQSVELLQQHLVEFLVLATGGPPHYTGRQIEMVHENMHISNPEFDATMGDLKATLDTLKVPNLEQKELLAIVESTRPQIVTEH